MAETASTTAKSEKAEEKAEEPTFTVAEILERSDGFVGVPIWVAAGAFSIYPSGKKLTVAQAKARVEAWQKSDVSTDQEA